MVEPGYTISDARYAKGQKSVHCISDGGFKTRAMRLLCALNGRYSDREKAYIVSPTKAAKFEKLFSEGWDATFVLREFIPPSKEVSR